MQLGVCVISTLHKKDKDVLSGMLKALVNALFMTAVASFFTLPISTTHTIISSITRSSKVMRNKLRNKSVLRFFTHHLHMLIMVMTPAAMVQYTVTNSLRAHYPLLVVAMIAGALRQGNGVDLGRQHPRPPFLQPPPPPLSAPVHLKRRVGDCQQRGVRPQRRDHEQPVQHRVPQHCAMS